MEYGELPINLGVRNIDCKEMFFYQYLPIKMRGCFDFFIEERLCVFSNLIEEIKIDFIRRFGVHEFLNSYIYLTAKRMYQNENCNFNRKGYHSDGFMTDDINYIWSDKIPTIFNYSDFKLSKDDKTSINEMECQALIFNEFSYPENSLLILNQFNIHKVGDVKTPTLRTFVKVSFSKDKYDLIGNSKNYEIDYDWQMRNRDIDRNIPQIINND